jgi:hypothetical protein
MKELFVPYEQALELKELGIEVKSPYWYNPNGVLLMKSFECDDETISVNVKDIIEYWDGVIKDRIDAPTFSQAFRWFREKYDLFGCIDLHTSTPIHWYIRIDDIIKNDYVYHSEDENLKYNTYEEAELECVKKLIEIVKNK